MQIEVISSNSTESPAVLLFRRRFVSRWLLVCCAWLALLPGVSGAVSVAGLYTATVRVTDRSEAARNAAIDNALGVVLTKVSGRRDAGTRAGVSNAVQLMQRYSYVAGGQLEVGFDSEAIHAALDRAGLPLWDRERPNTLIVYPTALQGLREARAATELAARNRGLPVVWAGAETSEQYPATALAEIQSLAQRYEAEAVLLARMGASGTPSDLRWQLVFRGTTQEAAGGVEDGPALAAEQMGRYYAVSSREVIQMPMRVSGVDGIEAYGNTLNYLSGLLLVRGVAVTSLQGDELRLQLELRGSAEGLRRVLAVDKRLTAISAEADAGVLRYQYGRP